MTLAELHARFDGPVPPHLLRAAQLGSETLAELLAAESNARFYEEMADRQRDAILARQGDGSFYPEMILDLEGYVARLAYWRERVEGMKAEVRDAA